MVKEDLTFPPPKEPDDQVVFPCFLTIHGVVVCRYRSNVYFKGGGRQPSLQPLLQKGKHSPDRASPEVLSVRGIPLDMGAIGCSVSDLSSLTLNRVCARRLTGGGDAYLHRPWGQLCARSSVPSLIASVYFCRRDCWAKLSTASPKRPIWDMG